MALSRAVRRLEGARAAPPTPAALRRARSRQGRPGRPPQSPALADHVGQQAEEARALDRLGEFALLGRRDRGDARGHDLAALGDVARQQARVLIVDLRRVRRRRTGRTCGGGRRGGEGRSTSDCSSRACHHGGDGDGRSPDRHDRHDRDDRRAGRAGRRVRRDRRRRACAAWPRDRPHVRRRGS